MQLICCTKKLLKELDADPTDNVEPISSLLGRWHANLINIERRKCVLITNDSTLFTMFIPFLRKPDFRKFHYIFTEHLFKNLLNEGFSQRQIEAVLNEHEQILFSKTKSRSVLGSMNEQKIQLEWEIRFNGGLKAAPLYELNKKLNRNLLSAIGLKYPVEVLQERLKTI